jgi:uncharacterized protein (DUF2062 family)
MTTSPPDPGPAAPGVTTPSPAPTPAGWRGRLKSSFLVFIATLKGGHQSPFRSSLAFGLGVAIALGTPPGTHTPLALGLAVLFRLNGILAVAGTMTWQPFTAPFILMAQRRVGQWLLPSPPPERAHDFTQSWVKPVLVGAPLTALALGAASAALLYAGLLLWRHFRTRRPAPDGEAG